MPLNKTALGSLLVIFGVCAGYAFLDFPVAVTVKQTVLQHVRFKNYISDIPDFLTILVVVVTAFAFAEYLINKTIRQDYVKAGFYRLMAVSMPVVFAAKSLLKVSIGRITTRFWLFNQNAQQFHWLNGGDNYNGFPSGHMAVFTTLLLCYAWRYPRYRYGFYLLLVLLGVALVLTDYHFVSDVIAGWALGYVVVRSLDLYFHRSTFRH